MGRKHKKSKCPPCVPYETQVGNGLLNIAAIASKAGGALDVIGRSSLEMFDILFSAGGQDPATSSDLYTSMNSTVYDVSKYICGDCPVTIPCDTTNQDIVVTNYINYVISTGMNVMRLLDLAYCNTTNETIAIGIVAFGKVVADLVELVKQKCSVPPTPPAPLGQSVKPQVVQNAGCPCNKKASMASPQNSNLNAGCPCNKKASTPAPIDQPSNLNVVSSSVQNVVPPVVINASSTSVKPQPPKPQVVQIVRPVSAASQQPVQEVIKPVQAQIVLPIQRASNSGPVTPLSMPPPVKIASAPQPVAQQQKSVPFVLRPHSATKKARNPLPQSDLMMANITPVQQNKEQEAPKSAKPSNKGSSKAPMAASAKPEQPKNGKLSNLFTKLRKKMSSKSSDA